METPFYHQQDSKQLPALLCMLVQFLQFHWLKHRKQIQVLVQFLQFHWLKYRKQIRMLHDHRSPGLFHRLQLPKHRRSVLPSQLMSQTQSSVLQLLGRPLLTRLARQ